MKNIGTKKIQSKFTIGGDPELMLQDLTGKVISSIPVLKRDKYNPIILDKKNAIKCYADNSCLEYAFAPSTNKKDFVNKYRLAFQKGQKYLGKNYRLLVKSAHVFEENQLEAAYGIDPKEIGCNPEFSHWEQKVNDLGTFGNSTMRSGSSHIHVGNPKLVDFDTRHNALAMIEIFLGCASILWDNDPSSILRREKYGSSGSFRVTEYGFETRFMSNYMLNSPRLVELAYDLLEYSLSHIFNDTYKDVLKKINVEDVKSSINLCNKELAEKILIQAKLPKDLFNRVKEESKKNYSTKDFYKNWDIKV
jgi:hypothetical protein